MNYLKDLLDPLVQAMPSLIYAVLLLLLAFIVASVAKSLVMKLLKKLKAEKYTDIVGIADEKTGSSLDFVGKLVFFIVFLLFLPGVLDKLGMQSVSTPIAGMVSQFLNYIPNILAAVIILAVGVFVANIIRQLLTPILKKLNVDKIQEKAGIAADKSTTISSVIAYVVYALILIPVVIAALQALNISAISDPAIAMLNKIVLFLPNIFVAIAIIVVGLFIGKITGTLLTGILSGVGTDTFIDKVAPQEGSKLKNFSLSTIIGETVRYIIALLFVVEAINIMKLEVLQFVGKAIIAYLPFAISAIIIIVAALLLATWIESLILKSFPTAKVSAMAAKCVIIVLAVFMMLNQLGIATSIVNSAFIIILGALAIAFAVAFGIGGREFASNVLKTLETKLNTVNSEGQDE